MNTDTEKNYSLSDAKFITNLNIGTNWELTLLHFGVYLYSGKSQSLKKATRTRASGGVELKVG
jgi:hypothetical protein